MGTSGYLDDWGCLNIDGTVVVKCFDDLIPANGYVKIPEGATKIGERAFEDCASLTSVTIPEGVTSIGRWAFLECMNLEAAALPRSVRKIGYSAFGGCESLAVYYAGKEVHWRSIDRETQYYDDGHWWTASVFAPGARLRYDWQGPAPTFAANFRGRTDLTSAVIPAGTTYIRPGEYENCTNLRSVTIPEGVTSIKERAFSGCSSLRSVVIPRSVTSIGNKAFSDCSSLTSVTIPEGVTEIGADAFSGCESLRSVVIPRSVTEIGNDAFWGCENLTIYYGGSVWSKVHCGNGAFKDGLPVYCDWQGPAPDDDEQRVGAFAGRTDLTSAVIPRGTSYIGSNEYKGCVNLMSVVIPRSVRRIGNKAFTDCKCLTVYYEGSKAEFYAISWQDYPFHCTMRIEYNWSLQKPPDPIKTSGPASASIPAGTKEIREDAFSGCLHLRSAVIPDGVRSIGGGAFYACTGLSSVDIPDSVQEIGRASFFGCRALTDLYIPRGVKSIASAAFSACERLAGISIPAGVRSIEGWTFCGCEGLTSVTIPAGVTGIGICAFSGCVRLAAVAIPKSVKSIDVQAFYGCDALTVYYAGSAADWKKVRKGDQAFSDSAKIQYKWRGLAPGDVVRERPPRKQAAGGGAARGAGGFDLTNMTIPDGTTEIRPYAFMGCATLESVVIPDSVTRIGENAFAGCSRLASVTLSKSVAHIGTDAFSGCPLKELHYGGGKDEWLAITGDRPRSKGIKVNLYPKGLPS